MDSPKNCPMDMSDVSDSEFLSNAFTRNSVQYTMWDGITPKGKPAAGQCNLARGGGCHRATGTLVTYLYTSYAASIVIILAIVCTKTFSRK